MRHGPKYLLVITILLAGYSAALQHKTLTPSSRSAPPQPLAASVPPATMAAATAGDPASRTPAPPLPLVALVDTERAVSTEKKAKSLTVKKQPSIERTTPPPDFSKSFQSPADSPNPDTDADPYATRAPAPTPDWSFGGNKPESGTDAKTAGASKSLRSLADSANPTTEADPYATPAATPTTDWSFGGNKPETGTDAKTAGASKNSRSPADSANPSTEADPYATPAATPTTDWSVGGNKPESGTDAKTAGAKAKPAGPKPAEKKGSPANRQPTDIKAPAMDRKAAVPKPSASDRKDWETKTFEQPQAADSRPLAERKSGEKPTRDQKKNNDHRAKNQDDSQLRELAEARPKPADAKVPAAKKDAAPSRTASATRRHRIAPGDTLEKLAEKYWGDRSRAAELYRANENLLPDPRLLPIGVEIAIPARATVTPNRQLADASPASSEPDRLSEGLVPVRQFMRPLPPVEQ